jgi:hypothetical protein
VTLVSQVNAGIAVGAGDLALSAASAAKLVNCQPLMVNTKTSFVKIVNLACNIHIIPV